MHRSPPASRRSFPARCAGHVLCRADQRHQRLRGSRRTGHSRWHQCRALCAGQTRRHFGPRSGVYRRARGRFDDQGHQRTLPHDDQPLRIPPAAASGCRFSSDRNRPCHRLGQRRTPCAHAAKTHDHRRNPLAPAKTWLPKSDALDRWLLAHGQQASTGSVCAADLLRRPGLCYEDLADIDPRYVQLPFAVSEQVNISLRYAGYIEKEHRQVEAFRQAENQLLPQGSII
ncbi:MAG: hypothetical protein ACLUI3_01380 [Christensenellales bacterium]